MPGFTPCSRQMRCAWLCADAGATGGKKAVKMPATKTLPSAMPAWILLLVTRTSSIPRKLSLDERLRHDGGCPPPGWRPFFAQILYRGGPIGKMLVWGESNFYGAGCG